MNKRLIAIIYGHVQGVNFRVSVKSFADKLGLVGYTENQKDGSVKVIAHGSDKILPKLLEYLHKGPFLAKVSHVHYSYDDKNGNFISFKIKRHGIYVLDQARAYAGFIKNILTHATKNS